MPVTEGSRQSLISRSDWLVYFAGLIASTISLVFVIIPPYGILELEPNSVAGLSVWALGRMPFFIATIRTGRLLHCSRLQICCAACLSMMPFLDLISIFVLFFRRHRLD